MIHGCETPSPLSSLTLDGRRTPNITSQPHSPTATHRPHPRTRTPLRTRSIRRRAASASFACLSLRDGAARRRAPEHAQVHGAHLASLEPPRERRRVVAAGAEADVEGREQEARVRRHGDGVLRAVHDELDELHGPLRHVRRRLALRVRPERVLLLDAGEVHLRELRRELRLAQAQVAAVQAALLVREVRGDEAQALGLDLVLEGAEAREHRAPHGRRKHELRLAGGELCDHLGAQVLRLLDALLRELRVHGAARIGVGVARPPRRPPLVGKQVVEALAVADEMHALGARGELRARRRRRRLHDEPAFEEALKAGELGAVLRRMARLARRRSGGVPGAGGRWR
mmetsp:Transcript_20486/g.62424  ORF Transcript_20486/g.62424 Transcript_20486/m.62424 type:complete len:343 (-) Transcript_20486:198-1226(-)